eukprot:Lithocolla_globosa_v1_NODE_3366_length_1689_cov_19.564871.p2 type:complete len:114 gc:universal NODE_3366_length_1689_cov_19.564871:1100-1441(+)
MFGINLISSKRRDTGLDPSRTDGDQTQAKKGSPRTRQRWISIWINISRDARDGRHRQNDSTNNINDREIQNGFEFADKIIGKYTSKNWGSVCKHNKSMVDDRSSRRRITVIIS